MPSKIVQRSVPDSVSLSEDLHPVLERVYAARNIRSQHELDYSLNNLLMYAHLKGIDKAVELLYEHLLKDKHILVIGDFDADGATSCALAIRTLRLFGSKYIDYLVPNRFEYGYGLSPEIVDVARQQNPDLIVTVDNGISSHAGVRHARENGIDVLITDHHLPGPSLPDATVIVNPNQPDDHYPSKYLAGVGVIFNIMIALRAYLRANGWFDNHQIDDPNLAQMLDLVALGTVADVVPLDYNNRIMVSQGLARIRTHQACPGILVLLEIANRSPGHITAADLGFAIAPRLNAAGRLTDMSRGIECLLTDDIDRAREIARELDRLNKERHQIQNDMEESAAEVLEKTLNTDNESIPAGLCLYDENWHQGVVGILASRLREKYHRPVIVFAPDRDNLIKGSGRSIEGIHIRDVLESITTNNPGMIEKFGGHAMAAGLTIRRQDFVGFQQQFSDAILAQVDIRQLDGTVMTDGELEPEDINLSLAQAIQTGGPWGQGFPEPRFSGEFKVSDPRIVGGKHLKLKCSITETKTVSGIAFNPRETEWLKDSMTVRAVYRLDVNNYLGRTETQLVIEHFEPTA